MISHLHKFANMYGYAHFWFAHMSFSVHIWLFMFLFMHMCAHYCVSLFAHICSCEAICVFECIYYALCGGTYVRFKYTYETLNSTYVQLCNCTYVQFWYTCFK